MSSEQPAANTSNPAPGSMGIRQAFREIRRGIVVMWWAFFDWVAVVQWKALVLVSFLGMIIGGGIFKLPTLTFLIVVSSFIIKIVAGGKRSADLTASEATKRAETEQLERAVLEARMQALQAQIEPHFLFNTLASIDQLIQSDPPRASKMQQSLIRYLRSAMPQMREGGRPTLGQQVELSSAYLEIMAVRMEERLQPVMNVPEGLKSAVFPSMMLQTLVENAIKHGLEPQAAGRPSGDQRRSCPWAAGRARHRHRPGLCAEGRWRRGAGQYPRAVADLVQRPRRVDHQRADGGRHLRHDQVALRSGPGLNANLTGRVPECPQLPPQLPNRLPPPSSPTTNA